MTTGHHEWLGSGVLRPELALGIVTAITAAQARINFTVAAHPSGTHFEAQRYGRGEVGELVLIEGQVGLVLARIVDVRVPEIDRKALRPARTPREELDAFGFAQFLGTIQPDTLRISAGVASYPRIGDRVYAAPHALVSRIPQLLHRGVTGASDVALDLGTVSGNPSATVTVLPEKLFGRHCAVLGATGGGKSWTVARIIEQCLRYNAKVLLLDATGEYRQTKGPRILHHHVGSPVEQANGSTECCLPATDFQESDFIAMFEPSGKVQAPKLQEAMRSLRLVKLEPTLDDGKGNLIKRKRVKKPYQEALARFAAEVESPTSPFDASRLAAQVIAECVYSELQDDDTKWGNANESDRGYCYALSTRIAAAVQSTALRPIFGPVSAPFSERLEDFVASPDAALMRVCLSGVSYEYRARQLVVNGIGRALMSQARTGRFRERPLVVVVDEAHNFLGRSLGSEDTLVKLDSFELIAREGRKYGLNLCLATQRPRDLTEGVLSQIGTLVVHRLTNDRDREVVERACGEIDRTAAAFLANLRQGEAAIIGVDFPIPLTVTISRPKYPPASDGPDYQVAWSRKMVPSTGSTS